MQPEARGHAVAFKNALLSEREDILHCIYFTYSQRSKKN